MPKVSVIIPCYNQGQYLDEAVDSVLNQTFQDFEIIIVNDGSTDEFTNNLLDNYHKPKTKVISTQNQGLPSARNNGIKIASGEYICCLDADDKYEPSFLEKTSEVLDADINHELGFVTTWLQMFEGNNTLWNPDSCSPILLATENIVHVASLFRKECWEKVGGYATNLSGYQDWNFWISIVSQGYEWFQIKEPLFLYRVRKNSMVVGSNQKRLLLYSQIIENNKEFYIKNLNRILVEFQRKSTELLLSNEMLNGEVMELKNQINMIQESRSYQLSLIFENGRKNLRGFLMLPFKLIWFILPSGMRGVIQRLLKFFFVTKCLKKIIKNICNFITTSCIEKYAKTLPTNHAKNLNSKVTIIMLSFNRFQDTKKAIKNIYKYTKMPFEFIILDNNSDLKVKNRLKSLANLYSNIKLIFEDTNLGCAGGRKKAMKHATGEYILFLDNDILVTHNYLENLINRLEEDDKNVAACCKVVYPNGKIQFNGGTMVIDDDYAVYDLIDTGLQYDSPTTNLYINCEWIPGGATIWKKEFLFQFPINEDMKGAFEDNEVCLRIKKAGFNIVNSPFSIVIHNHMNFKSQRYQKKEKEYLEERYNKERTKDALILFYKLHGLILSFGQKGSPWDIMFNLSDKKSIIEFINSNLDK